MIYSSPEFLILFSLTLLVYLLSPTYKARFYTLLTSSLLFYSWAGIFDSCIFLFVVIISWLATYFAARTPEHKQKFITGGIIVMAVHLLFWKYGPWITRETQVLFPGFLRGHKLDLPLPVGISFFTLQGIAYLVDLNRGEASFIPMKQYLLFKSFFPQLVAGPIVRVPQLMPQLNVLRRPTLADIEQGLFLFCLGFFKKVFIADRCAPFVDPVFENPADYSRTVLFKAVLGYTVQIWADFSGYTDMGRGTAKMLGIQLPENFLSPYFAKTPSEFWRRWHITLSEWIRDYIYIPLGGNSGGLIRSSVVAITTMFISGLWHGANWTFVIWGFFHGVLLLLERMIKKVDPFSAKWSSRLQEFGSHLLMFSMISFGWLIFRAKSWGDALIMIKGLLVDSHSAKAVPYIENLEWCLGLCLGIQLLFYYDFKSKRMPFLDRGRTFWNHHLGRFPALQTAQQIALGFFLAAIVLFCISSRVLESSPAFIYFKF